MYRVTMAYNTLVRRFYTQIDKYETLPTIIVRDGWCSVSDKIIPV